MSGFDGEVEYSIGITVRIPFVGESAILGEELLPAVEAANDGWCRNVVSAFSAPLGNAEDSEFW